MEAPQQEGKSQRTRRLNDELHAFVRQRNLKACLAALAQGEKDKNVDGRSYATACAACGDAGEGQKALELLRTAGARGGKCSPGVEACTAAVKALGSNDVDAAFSTLLAMVLLLRRWPMQELALVARPASAPEAQWILRRSGPVGHGAPVLLTATSARESCG